LLGGKEMLDLTKEERNLLNRIGKKGKVFRQAEVFTLDKAGQILVLDSEVCQSLINKGAIKEIQENDEAWIYVVELKLFAPNYIVDHNGLIV
jgi:hypothetical protein